jgi:rubrerythrin
VSCSDRDLAAIASWMRHDQGDDPGRVEDKRMACCDHICRACKHSWFSNTNDENCELCGSDDIQDIFDESPSDYEDRE